MGVATVILASALASQPATALAPTSKWYVDYATDACTVGRAFGSPKKPIVFAIIADAMGHGVTVELIDSRVAGTMQKRAVEVRFAPNALPIAFDGATVPIGPDAMQKLSFNLDEEGMRRLAGATSLAIGVRATSPTMLDLPGLAAAMAALEKCRVDLVVSWGMSEAEQRRVKVLAKVLPPLTRRYVFDTDDYPTEALRNHQSGATSVRIRVEADGRLSDCTVTRSSGSQALDATTCRVIKQRARYSPARDDAGTPIASIDTVKIKWTIPQ